jgi:hypothetical protein
MPRTAFASGIRKLYHYDEFNPLYLEDLLTRQRVHCSDPANLNDPWDCRPWFDPTNLDRPEVLERFIDWVFSFGPTSPISEEDVRAMQRRLRIDKNYRLGIFESFSRRFIDLIPGRWRLYCLTPYPDSTLMWSHYADNHKGICLEYLTASPLIGAAQEVKYLSLYPEWAPYDLMAKREPHVLLTKSLDWEYEREYRIICMAEGVRREINDHPLILRDGYLRLPDGALESVIAGCESDYERIGSLVSRCAPQVKLKRAVRSAYKYEIQIT